MKKEVDLSKPKPYKLIVKTKLKSGAKLLGLIPIKSFVSGEHLMCSFQFKNVSNERFPGTGLRRVPIEIRWPSRQVVKISFLVPPMDENETCTTPTLLTEALCEGFGLIFIPWRTPDIEDKKGIKRRVLFYRSKDGLRHNDNIGVTQSISSIRAKPREEIYEFWAMIISAAGLAIIALEKILFFLNWLITN